MGCNSSIPQHTYDVWVAGTTDVKLEAIAKLGLIVNPYSGKKMGAKTRDYVVETLATKAPALEVVVFNTEYAGHAMEMARDSDWSGFGALASVGGDGTVHEVTSGLLRGYTKDPSRGHPPPLCIIPCGSGNTFAYDMGIISADDAISALLSAGVRAVDVVQLTDPDDPTVREYPRFDDEAADADADEGDKGDKGEADGDAAAHAPDVAAEAKPDGADDAVAAPAPAAADATSSAAVSDVAAVVESKTDGEAGATGAAASASAGAAAPAEGSFPEPIYSINIAGFGLPAAVMEAANGLRCCGGAKYNCAAYLTLIKHRAYTCTVEFPGDAPEGWDSNQPFIMVQSQSTVHMGEKMPFCPRSRLNDGLMDLVGIPYAGRGRIVDVMESAKVAGHLDKPGTMYVQTSEYVLRPAEQDAGPMTVNVDGELIGFSPVRVKVLPKAMRFFQKPSGAPAIE